MNKKIVKISIYNENCTPSEIMQGNGDAILDNICISCETEEKLETGEYYLDATFLVDKEGLWKNIQEESILKVQMDYGNEIFRISKITSSSDYITVFARQETMYQTLHMWLTDVRPENRDGLSALNHIKENCIGSKKITFLSDISKLSTAYYMDMNVYEALHTCDQSFLNRWGGEIQRRGYNLSINNRLGTHRGVQIRSKKNLTGFEVNVDMDNVFTRIKPKGFDGITIDGFVDSPLINNYPDIKTKEIKYDNVKVKENENEEEEEGFDTLEEAQVELRRLANLEFSQNNIDKIQANYRINFIELEKTEEYKNYIQVEKIYLGDEVDVFEDKLGVNLTVRSITKKYDVMNQKVSEVELSNNPIKTKIPTVGDLIDKLEGLEQDIEENNNWYKDAVNNATDLIQNGLKDSYVVVRKNEILVMDSTDINTAINVWRWNKNGLGFSRTGYYGEFDTAITMDGSIVGKFITGLIVNGHQINAKNLNVYNSSGVKTLEVTSGGDVNLNVNSLNIKNEKIENFYQKGVINLIPNSTALDNTVGWLSMENCNIKRVNTTSTGTERNVSKIHFFERAGDTFVIEDIGGKTILVDGGYPNDIEWVIDYMRNTLNIVSIDYVLATHCHSDHIGGTPALMDAFGCQKLFIIEPDWSLMPAEETEWQTREYYNTLMEKANQLKCEIIRPTEGMKLALSVDSEFIFYNTNCTDYSDYNNISYGFKYNVGQNKIFLAGDMTKVSEALVKGQIGQVDFLKLGHHGTGSSSGSEFIKELKPRLAMYTSNLLDSGTIGSGDIHKRISLYDGKSYTFGETNSTIITFVIDKFSTICEGKEFPSPPRGWFEDYPGGWYFFENGQIVKDNWILDGGIYYYFDATGLMARNKFIMSTDKENYYFVDDTGHMVVNKWQQFENEWYYFDNNGVMYKNKWLLENGSYYYFKSDGKMAKNETLTIDGQEYTFNESGVMQ